MRLSTLLKLMLAAALPLYVSDDDTAPAAEAKPQAEAGTSGIAGAATDVNTLEADALPNAGASLAASPSENAASSSAQNASRAVDTEVNASNAGANEHPHTSLLRGLVSTLRRKWNVFDAELEALLRDAENRL